MALLATTMLGITSREREPLIILRNLLSPFLESANFPIMKHTLSVIKPNNKKQTSLIDNQAPLNKAHNFAVTITCVPCIEWIQLGGVPIN